MPHQTYKDFRFIEVHEGFVWPYHPKMGLIAAVSRPEHWEEVQKEFGKFLDDMGELNIGNDTLIMKMNGVYVFTEDTFDKDKIKNRERMEYEVVSNLFDDDRNYILEGQPIIGVWGAYESLGDLMATLRFYWRLGYEVEHTIKIKDLWDGEKNK